MKVGVDLVFWAIPSLFIGAKLVYHLQFGFPERLSDLWGGSIALYGGFFGILTPWVIIYLIRPYNVPMFLDCVTPGLALGLVLTRIGCFLQGCNGGLVCSLPWAVQFPRGTASYAVQVETGLIRGSEPFSLPVHPTQLYESLFGLLALPVLYWLFQKSRLPGQTFLTGMLGYAVFRFLTESIRSDTQGLHPFTIFTFAQFLSLLIAGGAVLGLVVLRIRRHEAARA